MPLITPNFNFNGDCAQAIELYKKAFGARVGCLLRYSDANPADRSGARDPATDAYIYHCEMYIGDNRIMLSDNPDVPFTKSLSLSLVVTFETKEQVERAYEVMKESSETIYPMHSTTYSSCFVAFVDRFGIRWALMTETT